jgi:hypothetical protein
MVAIEDLAGRGHEPVLYRRRGQHLNAAAETGQAVGGSPFVLEGQRHDPPAVLVGRKRRLERGPGRLAEDLVKYLERLRRRPERDLEPGPAGRELGRPPRPEPGQLEVRRALEGLGQDERAANAPGPENQDGPRLRPLTGPGHRHQVPGSCLVHQAKRPDHAGLVVAAIPVPVPEPQRAAQPEGLDQIPQAGHLLLAAEPPWHIEMDQRAGGQPGGDLDLPVRRVQGMIKTELAQRFWHPQDEQGLGLLRPQTAEREPVVVHQPAAAAGPGLGDDRNARGAERLQVTVDGPDTHPELGGERPRGHHAPRLKQQDQAEQAVGAHERKTRPIADTRCQR